MGQRSSGVIIWQDISRIDGKTPIVCILTGLARKSRNPKTGPMLQTWIIRRDMLPTEAIQGKDAGICGGCPHRMQRDGTRSCYVNVWQAPLAILDAYIQGAYPQVSRSTLRALVTGHAIRFGAYGDPAATPLWVWETLSKASKGRHTGYTHQWRSKRFEGLAAYVQASCETLDDVALAHSKGFRGSFLVLPQGATIPPDALHCPASAERGHATTCENCLACNGRGGAFVAIHAHERGRQHVTGEGRRSLRVLQVLETV